MPRKRPPEGFYTAHEAYTKLDVSEGMLYNYVRAGTLERVVPPGRKQGFYRKVQVDKLADELHGFFGEKGAAEIVRGIEFMQATPDDMEGVYEVAQSLFGHTTSAEQRKSMVARCPAGNYVVKDNGKVVAFIHVQPLKHERLMAFMHGEIRGWELTPNDLEPFAVGKSVECLIKSIGATEAYGRQMQLKYLRRLLRGVQRELVELGRKGYIISKFYATSETPTGIMMALNAHMMTFGNPIGKRQMFVLDVEKSDLMPLATYKEALAAWQQENEASV